MERLHALIDGVGRQRIGQRRELVRLIVERVDVPAKRGARFDASRVRLSIPLASSTPRSAAVNGSTPPEGVVTTTAEDLLCGPSPPNTGFGHLRTRSGLSLAKDTARAFKRGDEAGRPLPSR